MRWTMKTPGVVLALAVTTSAYFFSSPGFTAVGVGPRRGKVPRVGLSWAQPLDAKPAVNATPSTARKRLRLRCENCNMLAPVVKESVMSNPGGDRDEAPVCLGVS